MAETSGTDKALDVLIEALMTAVDRRVEQAELRFSKQLANAKLGTSNIEARALKDIHFADESISARKIKGDISTGGKSAYQIAVDGGYIGTEDQWLASLNGTDGKSAYELAVAGGYVGTETQWLASLHGTNGQGLPAGGTIGQALVKSGLPDFATGWATIPRQYTTMPTITAELLGSVAQYAGVTGTYTFGHFYAAVSDGESTPTYRWEKIVYDDPDSVSYSEQTGKTEAEKVQARTNIGAAAMTGVITAFGEIGYSAYTTVYGQITAIKQPNGKYTISICAVPTAITRGNTFYFLSIAKIVALLGLSGALSWERFNSRVITTATVSASYMQYGLAVSNDDAREFVWLGRVYTTAGAVGGWPLSETGLFVTNAQYLIWIYDATIA